MYRNGKKMRFLNDNTACANIIIENNTFYCDGTPALGNHKSAFHKEIYFRDNVVYGTASISDTSRGYIAFTKYAKDVEVYNNKFHAEDVDKNIVNWE